MKQAIYAVYGASGFGREIMPLLREQLLRDGVSNDEILFVDDNRQVDIINSHKVISYQDFLDIQSIKRYVAVGIADSDIRKKIVEEIGVDGVQFLHVFAPSALMMDQIELGEGGILCPFVTLTSNIKIGKFFQANIYSYVGHDCQLGDYVTFAPGVKCNGNVVIEDKVYVGTGAMIKQGRPGDPLIIGNNAVIGMGAVVTKNVPAGITVVGNPAVPLIKV